MNRKQKLRRLAAVLVVFSALAVPCAGWGWDGAADVDGAGDAPAALAGP
jgi:hypothetical protein